MPKLPTVHTKNITFIPTNYRIARLIYNCYDKIWSVIILKIVKKQVRFDHFCDICTKSRIILYYHPNVFILESHEYMMCKDHKLIYNYKYQENV